MIGVSWSQSKSRACGGALPSGNIANSAEGSLPFRCARILSISPVVRHSLFNAGNDLDLTTAPLAGLDVNVEHPFEPLHPGHRRMALGGRLVQPVLPCRLTPLASPAPLHAGVTRTRSLLLGAKTP
jgi:hypothetical protein